MIRFFSIVFLILFLIQMSYNTFVYIQFKVQQNYIASQLCVNRGMATNTCKGNCYLKAHLQKEETESSTAVSYVKEKTDLFFTGIYFEAQSAAFIKKEIYPTVFFELIIQTYNDVFHPPAFSFYKPVV